MAKTDPYQAMIDASVAKLEPEAVRHPLVRDHLERAPMWSIAISLKRIADLMQERDDGHD